MGLSRRGWLTLALGAAGAGCGGPVAPQPDAYRRRHAPYCGDPDLQAAHGGCRHVDAAAWAPREFALLRALMRALMDRPGAVLSRTQLEEMLYG
jgi:hypothetical protein